MTETDIVIVGGGMVGLAMAAALADTGLQIAVLERAPWQKLSDKSWLSETSLDAGDYDTRVSAISPGNQSFLQAIGAWQRLPACRKADYEKMHVWDANGSGAINFDAAELAEPLLGTIVENQALRAALYQGLSGFGNVQLLQTEKLCQIREGSDSVVLEASDGQCFSARLLIGADGAFSQVRQLLQIDVDTLAYQQSAFVANVVCEKQHQDTAWQRFTTSGPVAFLPLPQANLCSIVWSVDQAKADQLGAASGDEFARKLARAFELRFGQVSVVSDIQAFPLVARHAQHYLASRSALIGDAAHTIHPLAGQGVNLGFQDVACLARRIRHLLNKNRDIGLSANLRPFERERKTENSQMQHAMSGFKWLFGNQSLPLTLLRNLGLSAVDRNGLIKQQMIRHAMGL